MFDEHVQEVSLALFALVHKKDAVEWWHGGLHRRRTDSRYLNASCRSVKAFSTERQGVQALATEKWWSCVVR